MEVILAYAQDVVGPAVVTHYHDSESTKGKDSDGRSLGNFHIVALCVGIFLALSLLCWLKLRWKRPRENPADLMSQWLRPFPPVRREVRRQGTNETELVITAVNPALPAAFELKSEQWPTPG